MATSSSPSLEPPFPSSFNISHHFRQPMDHTTFLCWKSQFLDILEIHDFSNLIDSAIAPLSKTLPDHSPNPAYIKWVRSDKLVLSWIKATISSPIQMLLLPCKTSSEAWALLEKRLSPLSKVHVRALRDQLRSLKKEPEQSITDFLLHAKSIFDSLASAGETISETELVDSLLDGLGSEYKEFITALHLRPQVPFDDVYDLLIQEESLQKKLSAAAPSSATALVVQSSSSTSASSSSSRGHGSGGSRGHGKGRGGGRWTSSVPPWAAPWASSPSSQSWPTPPSTSRGSSDQRPPLLPTPASLNTSVACQICNLFGHTARLCPQ